MVEIKCCGMTRPEDVAFASSKGASYVGVIFAGGPRNLDAHRAAAVFEAAGEGVRRVGVFAADYAARIPEVLAVTDLEVVQLHADPTAEMVKRVRSVFEGEIWAAVRVPGSVIPGHARALLETADGVLLDPKVEGTLGGTGVALDWAALAPGIDASRGARARIVLAGGLTHENVAVAIAATRPDVVDVSSGIESAPGIKDHERISAFFDAVRRSEA